MTDFTLEAAADLSAKQYHIVRASGANLANQASLNTDAAIVGVLQNNPQSGEGASIKDSGVGYVVAGGSITVNDRLTTNSSGRAATAASGQVVIGRALEAAAANGDKIQAIYNAPWELAL